ncbi:hypothetical protein ACJX0J_023251, partial [Zea mays]
MLMYAGTKYGQSKPDQNKCEISDEQLSISQNKLEYTDKTYFALVCKDPILNPLLILLYIHEIDANKSKNYMEKQIGLQNKKHELQHPLAWSNMIDLQPEKNPKYQNYHKSIENKRIMAIYVENMTMGLNNIESNTLRTNNNGTCIYKWLFSFFQGAYSSIVFLYTTLLLKKGKKNRKRVEIKEQRRSWSNKSTMTQELIVDDFFYDQPHTKMGLFGSLSIK